MLQGIQTIAEVEKRIAEGKTLLLAGEEALLATLPTGNWIGGTIPYFITPRKDSVTPQDKILVTDISSLSKHIEIKMHSQETLPGIYSDAEEKGFSFIIIPAMSAMHSSFALNGPNYRNFGNQPLIGWISGVPLSELGAQSPKVFNGQTGHAFEHDAVVMHVTLPLDKVVDVGIVNIFEQGDGDSLTFPADGFSCTDVSVNGVKENFAHYIERLALDTKVPLVANYYGAMINTSFQSVDAAAGKVTFYAPVFTGVPYMHAKAVADYATAFDAQLKKIGLSENRVVFSCNCILNYLYSNLEGKGAAPFVGPITCGEIAYQLLNQTLVYLEVHDV